MQAAIEATREIGLAVLATTLSLVAIFVPVGFMGGIVGRFMTSFGFTMAFAILVSLLVSFTLTPMLSARWIKMRPRREDAEGHEIEEASTKDSRFFRPLDRAYTSMLHVVARRIAGRSPALAVLVLLSSVPLFMIADKNFLPNDDQSEFEVGTARAGRHGHRCHRDHRQPHRDADPPAARGRVHAGDRRRRSGANAERRDGLHASEAGRSARPGSVRGDERRARQHPAQGDGRQSAHRRAAGRDDRRRRQPERGDPVHHQRAGSQEARDVRGGDCRRGEEGARRRRRRHVDERRQARAVGAHRPDEGGGPRRQGVGRGRSAAAARRRRPGHDLQRGRRAVRGARARRAGRARHRGRDRPADRAVRQGRQRAARQPGAHGAGDVAVGDQPAEPPAPGDDLRRPAAGRLADRPDGPDDQDAPTR